MKADIQARTEILRLKRLSNMAIPATDPVNHPPHYTAHPSGIECIQITEHMNFCIGNAVKYLWRAGKKGSAIEDLKKAKYYIDREIARIEKSSSEWVNR